jgi:predicted transcriptional regulator
MSRKRDRIRRSSSALSSLYVPETPVAEAGPPRRRRANEGHPHAMTGSGADMHRHQMPDKGPSRQDYDSPVTVGHAEAVEQNLATMQEADPNVARSEEQIYGELTAAGVRGPFAAMAAHQEIAAVMLAAGATLGEAAQRAGVTEVTVSRYWAEDSFRRRVFELRSIVMDGINGRIVGELDRRTKGRNLQNMELLDVLRVFDRTNPKPSAGEKRAVTVAGNLNVTQLNYAGIAAEIAGPDAAEEVPDFLVIGPGGAAVAGDSA